MSRNVVARERLTRLTVRPPKARGGFEQRFSLNASPQIPVQNRIKFYEASRLQNTAADVGHLRRCAESSARVARWLPTW